MGRKQERAVKKAFQKDIVLFLKVERMVRDHEAGGSNPLTPTILK
ncbi:hypothetical protein [uncultured Acetobacterium sp.]|nr:hypothetical protein [uncultured Acetobacterium sp.]